MNENSYKVFTIILIILLAVSVLVSFVAVNEAHKRLVLSASCNPYTLEHLGEKECRATITAPTGAQINVSGTYDMQVFEMP